MSHSPWAYNPALSAYLNADDVAVPVAFRSISGTTYATRVNTTVTAPAGITDGDMLILVHVIGGAPPPSVTLPAGFTLLSGFPSTVTDGAFDVTTRVAYKTASSESGSYTLTHASGNSQGEMLALSGAAPIAPSATVNTGLGATTTATGLTTPTDGTLVAYIAHNWVLYGSGSPPIGTTPTFTEREDSATSLIYVATGVLAAAGATGSKTQANGNGAFDPWTGILVAVTPVPGDGTVTSVSVASANGVSAAVSNPTTTPSLTFSLGAITPTSVAASGAVTGSNLSGTNTGDQTLPVGANPSASLGLAAVNGVATTFMRSDGAPALSQAIIPTWTGTHTFNNTIVGSVSGSSGSTTGNAATATALQTARNINGTSFNGTADITVTAAAGTLTGATLAAGVTASSLTSVGTLSTLAVTGTTTIGSTSGTYRFNVDNGGTSGSKLFKFSGSGITSLFGYSDGGGSGITNSDPYSSGCMVYLTGATTIDHYINGTSVMTTKAAGLSLNVAGAGISIKEGANAKMGTATLVSGTVVVNNTSVTANSRIFLTPQETGLFTGSLRVSARTAGTSFTILSTVLTDTCVVAYEIFEPS